MENKIHMNPYFKLSRIIEEKNVLATVIFYLLILMPLVDNINGFIQMTYGVSILGPAFRTLFFVLLCIVFLLDKSISAIDKKRYIAIIFFFLAVHIIYVVLGYSKISDIRDLLKIFYPLFLFYILNILVKSKRISSKNLKKALKISIFMYSLFVLTSFFVDYKLFPNKEGYFGGVFDLNGLMLIYLIMLPVLARENILFILFNLAAYLLTTSKATPLFIVALLYGYTVSNIKNSKINRKKLAFRLLLLVIGGIVFIIATPSIRDYIMNHSYYLSWDWGYMIQNKMDVVLGNITYGRTTFVRMFLSNVHNKSITELIIGSGITNAGKYIYYGKYLSEMDLVDAFNLNGIIGIFIYFYLYIISLKKVDKTTRVLLLVPLLYSVTGGHLYIGAIANIFYICIITVFNKDAVLFQRSSNNLRENKLRILIVHNRYKVRGGEDMVVNNQIELLKEYGHEVYLYSRDSRKINYYNKLKKAKLVIDAYGSLKTKIDLGKIIKEFKPDIAHVHNIYPLISPSVYSILHDNNIPVIQTLHNYRFICANGLLFHDGKICTECLESKSYYSCVRNKCYHNSYIQSLWYSSILDFASRNKIFENIDKFIALNDLTREFMIDRGFNADKLEIIPNYVQLELQENNEIGNKQNYIIYVGRLSREKGIMTLLEAMKQIKDIELKIVGEGELHQEIVDYINDQRLSNVEVLGFKTGMEKYSLIKNAKALVFPSEVYETFGLTIIEAFASTTFVIAANLGGIPDIVQDKYNGLLFHVGNSDDLADKVNYIKDNSDLISDLSHNAYKSYREKYTREIFYTKLNALYEEIYRNK